MSFFTTGIPFWDLVIALVAGYTLAWLFLARPVRRELHAVESRTNTMDSQLRTSQRETRGARDENKALNAKFATSEEALAAARRQISALQNQVAVASDEKSKLVAELEAKDVQIAEAQALLAAAQEQELKRQQDADDQVADRQQQWKNSTSSELNSRFEQAQVEKRALETQLAAIQTEGEHLKRNLSGLLGENDTLKWRITAMQADNQLIRTQSGNVLSELEILLWRITPMLRRALETAPTEDKWLHNNLTVDGSLSSLPHFVPSNGGKDVRDSRSG
jgi:chromosome segregation ATPase